MKKILFIFIILASAFLASCQNSNENTANLNSSGEELPNTSSQGNSTQNALLTPKRKRISYQEYVQKNGINSQNATRLQQEITTNDNVAQDQQIETPETSSNTLLAKFSTPLQGSSDERINNIEIVCERLNNYILKPNETFSYNNVTGPFGPSDGFEEAPILLSNGKKEEGYGGGVCQLSSTLYNVVKVLKNVPIIERHHHSAPVSYVKNGQDATVSLQSNLDFQFKNNNDYPIQFKASCENNSVNVWAYQVTS